LGIGAEEIWLDGSEIIFRDDCVKFGAEGDESSPVSPGIHESVGTFDLLEFGVNGVDSAVRDAEYPGE
jgi:hypothetical protein